MDIFGELLYLLTSRKNQIVVLSKFKIGMLTREIVNVAGKGLTAGDIAQAMAGPAMAIWEAQEVRSRCTSSRFSPARWEKR